MGSAPRSLMPDRSEARIRHERASASESWAQRPGASCRTAAKRGSGMSERDQAFAEYFAARPEWDGLPVAAQREVLRLLFDDIRVGKPVHTLTRWSTDTQRLAAATARMRVTWRRPGTPVAAARQPGEKPGGARAQRRRQTSIELASGQHAGTAA